MAKARMYGWSEKRHNGSAKKIAELKGQAKIVADTLDSMTDARHDETGEDRAKFLATEVNEQVVASGKLVTRQDPERVTLYYLLIFKKRGWIEAAEAPVTEESETNGEENAETVETEELPVDATDGEFATVHGSDINEQ